MNKSRKSQTFPKKVTRRYKKVSTSLLCLWLIHSSTSALATVSEEQFFNTNISIEDLSLLGESSSSRRSSYGLDDQSQGVYPGPPMYEACQKFYGGKEGWDLYQKYFHYVSNDAAIRWQPYWGKLLNFTDQHAQYFKRNLTGIAPEILKQRSEEDSSPSGQIIASLEEANLESSVYAEKLETRKKYVTLASKTYLTIAYKLGMQLAKMQRNCAALMILTSQSVSSTMRGPRSAVRSFDGKITCQGYGKVTQDYDACKDIVDSYHYMLAGKTGLEEAQRVQTQLASDNFSMGHRGPAGIGGGTGGFDHTAAIKAQLKQQQMATQQAGAQAAFETLSISVLGNLAQRFPDHNDMVGYCQKAFPSEQGPHPFALNSLNAYIEHVHKNNESFEAELNQINQLVTPEMQEQLQQSRAQRELAQSPEAINDCYGRADSALREAELTTSNVDAAIVILRECNGHLGQYSGRDKKNYLDQFNEFTRRLNQIRQRGPGTVPAENGSDTRAPTNEEPDLNPNPS